MYMHEYMYVCLSLPSVVSHCVEPAAQETNAGECMSVAGEELEISTPCELAQESSTELRVGMMNDANDVDGAFFRQPTFTTTHTHTPFCQPNYVSAPQQSPGGRRGRPRESAA